VTAVDLVGSARTRPAPGTRLPLVFGGLGAAIPVGGQAHQRDLEPRRLAQATLELADAAVRRALVDACLTVDDIDLVVVTTATAGQPLPSTACLVARDLGLRCPSFDLTAAGSGWIYGLVTVAAMLGAARDRAALVIAADLIDRGSDPHLGGPQAGALLPHLAGGAVAAVVTTDRTGTDGPGLVGWDLGVDGAETDAGQMWSRSVRMETSCRKTLRASGVTDPGRVSRFLLSGFDVARADAIARGLGLTNALLSADADLRGDPSGGIVPLVLCGAVARGGLSRGDLVLMTASTPGGGWASVLLRWGYGGRGPGDPIVLDGPADTASAASP